MAAASRRTASRYPPVNLFNKICVSVKLSRSRSTFIRVTTKKERKKERKEEKGKRRPCSLGIFGVSGVISSPKRRRPRRLSLKNRKPVPKVNWKIAGRNLTVRPRIGRESSDIERKWRKIIGRMRKSIRALNVR